MLPTGINNVHFGRMTLNRNKTLFFLIIFYDTDEKLLVWNQFFNLVHVLHRVTV